MLIFCDIQESKTFLYTFCLELRFNRIFEMRVMDTNLRALRNPQILRPPLRSVGLRLANTFALIKRLPKPRPLSPPTHFVTLTCAGCL